MDRSTQTTPLENAFAHNNGIEILTDNALIARLEKGDAHNIADTWFQEFTNVHKRLFSSRDFNHADEAPGFIINSRGGSINQELTTLVKQLYDEGGFAKKPPKKDLSSYLASAYIRIRNINPFRYGENFALLTFFALIGKTKALTDDKGTKLDIDFHRLDAEDWKTLDLPTDGAKKKENWEAIDRVFMKLITPSNIEKQIGETQSGNTSLPFDKRWASLPKSEKVIAQKHFLSHTFGHTPCLVAIDGGLVPLDAVEGDIINHINRGESPATFKVSRNKMIGHLIKDGREHRDKIDGIAIVNDEVPLFALNVDLLTGLDVTTQLPSVKDYCERHKTHIMNLPEYVKEHTNLPPNLEKRLKQAAERVAQIRDIVWQSVDRAFEGKAPVPDSDTPHAENWPKFFITMGGTGSGKSNLAGIAREYTSGNFVEASLDEARTKFSTYDLYAAVGRDLPEKGKNDKPVRTGHHFGDYIALETAAGYIREGIVARAMGFQNRYMEDPRSTATPDKNKRYHLLYDGSGVPYKGKYEGIVQKLSDKNFFNYVLVADAPIEKAYARAASRLEGPDGRAVPPKVIVEKHRGLPRAMRDAAKDEHVRHFEIIDTSRDVKGEHYILAHRVSLDARDDKAAGKHNQVKKLEEARKQKAKNPRALYDALQEEGLLPPVERLKYAPPGWEERVEFVVVSHNHHNHKSEALIITDADRMAAISRKGALNPDASGLEDLYTLHQPFETVKDTPSKR